MEKVIRTVDQEIVASYTYDAWGNILTATGTLAERNPIRYRGYYYDTETGFYYLQSRYYDPQTGRFINSDDPGLLGADGDFQSYSLFVYCGNNPVNKADTQGKLAGWLVGGITGALVGGLTSLIKGEGFAAGAVQGLITGSISGAAVDIALAAVATGGTLAVVVGGLIAFSGGAIGNIAAEETLIFARTGKLKKLDSSMVKRSMISGAINAASLGFSTSLEVVKKGNAFFKPNQKTIEIIRQAGNNIRDFSTSTYDLTSAFAATHFAIHGVMLS